MDLSDIHGHRRPMLQIRPHPFNGESWGGYLLRLSSRNHLKGLEVLASIMGLSWQELLVRQPMQSLRALGISWRGEIEDPPLGSQRPEHRVNLPSAGRTRRSRVCPSCLASDEVPYLRAAWEMPMATTCQVHDLLLLDRCGVCDRDLDMLRPVLTECLCSAQLAHQRCSLAPGWLKKLAMVFTEAEIEKPASTFGRSTSLAQEAARTCNWITAPVEPGSRRRRRRVIDREGFLTSRTLSALEPMFLNWPSVLASTLGCECDPTRADGCGFAALNYRLAVHTFTAMREVVNKVKTTIPRGQRPWSEINRRRAVQSEREVYGIKNLMNASGHSYTALVASIDAGQFPGATYKVDPVSGKKKFHIPAAVYHALVKHFRESCDIEDAALMLGCSEDAVRGLVRSKCVGFSPILQSGFRYRLDPVELSKMAARLFRLASFVRKVQSVERVYFSVWVQGRYHTDTADRWRVLLDAIRSRELTLYTALEAPVQLSDLYLLRDDLEKAILRSRAKRILDVRQSERRAAAAIGEAA